MSCELFFTFLFISEKFAYTCHEDSKIKFWDIERGVCSGSVVTHPDAVTDIFIDTLGMTFLTVGHDSSMRVYSVDDFSGKSTSSPALQLVQDLSSLHR
jgi:WD40 repeat protein